MENLFAFLEKNSIYIVLFIVLTIWVGIFTFLFNLEKRLKKIEIELQNEGNYNEK